MNLIDFQINTTGKVFIGIFSALCGGTFLRIMEKILNKKKEAIDDATQIRTELRKQVELLTAEIIEVKKEVTEWREKYWEQVELVSQQNEELAKLRIEIEQLRAIITRNAS